MTLLVRDEEDILDANIRYHLAQGVDFIIATDNRSVDGTAGILRQYESIGKLHYIFEPDDDYSQHKWVTRMARMACSRFAADWVINSDADEFWWPLAGSLKESLSRVPANIDVIEVQRHNFVAVSRSAEPFWAHMLYREAVSLNSEGKPLPPKVAHRGSNSVTVNQGNHSVEGFDLSEVGRGHIEILHYPVRSRAQIENKIAKGGAAYERNRELPSSTGGTWRALYEEYREQGHLHGYFDRVCYDDEALRKGVSRGDLVIDERLADYVGTELSGARREP